MRWLLWQAHLIRACHEADERLLHVHVLGDAVRVDSKEAHATFGPQVTTDAGADTRLEQAHDEIAGEGLSFEAKQRQVPLSPFHGTGAHGAAWLCTAQGSVQVRS